MKGKLIQAMNQAQIPLDNLSTLPAKMIQQNWNNSSFKEVLAPEKPACWGFRW